MTKQQYQHAKRLLAKDCAIKNRYFRNGETCAIGELALHSGVTKAQLQRAGSQFIRKLGVISGKIQSKFGLTPKQQAEIQYVNDSWDNVDDRRHEVVKKLTWLYKNQHLYNENTNH